MSTLVEEPVVLAVGAHHSDVECLCAGTLALLKERGWRVTLASMTPGDCGFNTLPSPALASLRRQQARLSAALLDAEYCCLEARDFTITYGDELCRRATALIRRVRPAIVMTHGPQEAMPDHEETARILRQACLAAPARNYETRDARGAAQPSGRIPHLYCFDPAELTDVLDRPAEPSLIVDITGAIDTKTRMLAQHAGQAVQTHGQQGVDRYVAKVLTWGQRRGQQAGCRYGEGFRQHLGPACPRDNLLKQVLGPLAHEVATAAS